jgi:hypothetical protein
VDEAKAIRNRAEALGAYAKSNPEIATWKSMQRKSGYVPSDG